MSAEPEPHLRLQIGHVLFIDIIGYSKLLITEQSELLRRLTDVVRETEQFRFAEAEGKLVRLPTGDGMALVFRNSPEAPVQCALELSKRLKAHPELSVRMGIHSGPVNEVADDLEQYPQWRAHLHDLGECEVKHGVRVSVVNLYTEELGNPEVPEKFRQVKETQTTLTIPASVAKPAGPSRALIAALIIVAAAAAAGFYIFSHRPSSKAPPSSVPPALPAISEKSIAVLPFENLSEEKANAYFADGIQDEILTRLSKIADLKVISRT